MANLDLQANEYSLKAIVTPNYLREASRFYRYQYNALIDSDSLESKNFADYVSTTLSLVSLVVPGKASLIISAVDSVLNWAFPSDQEKFAKQSQSAFKTLENYANYLDEKMRGNSSIAKFEINQAIRQFTLKNGSKIGVFDRCVITAYIDKYGNKAIQ